MKGLIAERLLASLGFGSRKDSRKIIRSKALEVDGQIIDDPNYKFQNKPEFIYVYGEKTPTIIDLYIMLHKPLQVECSHRPQHHVSVYSLLPERFLSMKLSSVGRLDVVSSGLLLLSNDGQFIHHLESPKRGILKRYSVSLARPFSSDQEQALLTGVALKGERNIVHAKSLKVHSPTQIELEIGEGLYHQVRRMFAAVGNHVESLQRIAVGDLFLDSSLSPGDWRFLQKTDLEKLSFQNTKLFE